MKNKMKRIGLSGISILVLIGGLVAARLWYLAEQGNFHPITAGEAYRSAQLDQDELEHYVQQFKIRSIINLRGKNTGHDWYEEETTTARAMGIVYFDYAGIGATRPPTAGELATLLKIYREAPRPVLIHCREGADRSGLASAIWKVVVDNESPRTAKAQLSLWFGHLPVGATQVLDQFFDQWTASRNVGG